MGSVNLYNPLMQDEPWDSNVFVVCKVASRLLNIIDVLK